jgi:hypothetical protein
MLNELNELLNIKSRLCGISSKALLAADNVSSVAVNVLYQVLSL